MDTFQKQSFIDFKPPICRLQKQRVVCLCGGTNKSSGLSIVKLEEEEVGNANTRRVSFLY